MKTKTICYFIANQFGAQRSEGVGSHICPCENTNTSSSHQQTIELLTQLGEYSENFFGMKVPKVLQLIKLYFSQIYLFVCI